MEMAASDALPKWFHLAAALVFLAALWITGCLTN